MRLICALLFINLVMSADIEDEILDWINNTTQDPSHDIKFERKTRCTTDDNKQGVCVKKSECSKDVEKLDLDAVAARRGECHYLQQCCPYDNVRLKSRQGSIVVNPGCGWSNPGANIFREKSKSYADFGDFPWMVALLKKTGKRSRWSKRNYLGGGTLIHPSVVMTVAHKVEEVDVSKIKCRAGEWDTKTDNEVYEYQEREVKKIISHNDYSRSNVHNDIALLILSQPFELEDAPHIGVACLGKSLPPSGTRCYSMGWGAEFYDKKQYATILKKVELPLVNPDSCQSMLRKTDLGKRFSLHSSFTCAGGEEGEDTCAGDGGSSLACPIGENARGTVRYAVFGMVAFGSDECGEKDVPGVYVNIPEMARWVDDQIMLEGLENSSYIY